MKSHQSKDKTKIHTHDFFELLIENFYNSSIIFFTKHIPRLFALKVGRGEKAVTLENLEFRMITFVPATQVRVTIDTDLVWTLDGERCDSGNVVEAKILHHAISLIQRDLT